MISFPLEVCTVTTSPAHAVSYDWIAPGFRAGEL